MPLTLAKETMDMNWKDAAASGSSQILLELSLIHISTALSFYSFILLL